MTRVLRQVGPRGNEITIVSDGLVRRPPKFEPRAALDVRIDSSGRFRSLDPIVDRTRSGPTNRTRAQHEYLQVMTHDSTS